jgi:hypothetical protein
MAWRTAGIHGAQCRLCGRNLLLPVLPKQCLEAAVEAQERARLGSRTYPTDLLSHLIAHVERTYSVNFAYCGRNERTTEVGYAASEAS